VTWLGLGRQKDEYMGGGLHILVCEYRIIDMYIS